MEKQQWVQRPNLTCKVWFSSRIRSHFDQSILHSKATECQIYNKRYVILREAAKVRKPVHDLLTIIDQLSVQPIESIVTEKKV